MSQARPTSGTRPDDRRSPTPRLPVAPILALVALVVAGIVSLNLLAITTSGPAGPISGGGGGGGNGSGAPPIANRPTPNPSVITTPQPEERVEVEGTILFARTGNIWAASGFDLSQLSTGGRDSSAAWTADGSAIYLIETREKRTRSPAGGTDTSHLAHYTLYYPVIIRMAPDGSDREEIKDSLFQIAGGEWFSWLRDPDPSPDGEMLVLASDGANGQGEVVVSMMPSDGGDVESLELRSSRGLGHSAPEWSPDGTEIAFTFHSEDDSGAADTRIAVVNAADNETRLLRGKGYASPAWSPDGSQIAAERSTPNGRDIVIMDAAAGEVARLTDDGRSFAPAFSPDGTQIAYLHLDGPAIDLRVMTLARAADGGITVAEDKAITEDGSLDAGSPPSWWGEADVPPPTTRPSGAPSPGASEADASQAP